jgi:hypothetical protein
MLQYHYLQQGSDIDPGLHEAPRWEVKSLTERADMNPKYQYGQLIIF